MNGNAGSALSLILISASVAFSGARTSVIRKGTWPVSIGNSRYTLGAEELAGDAGAETARTGHDITVDAQQRWQPLRLRDRDLHRLVAGNDVRAIGCRLPDRQHLRHG